MGRYPHEECKTYKLLTVTFGTASAPFLIVHILVHVADVDGHKYSKAALIIKSSFYKKERKRVYLEQAQNKHK